MNLNSKNAVYWYGRGMKESTNPLGSVTNREYFCNLHKAIARFYLNEMLRVEKEQQYSGILPYSYRKHFHSEVSACSVTLLKFFLSAAVGEARHFKRVCLTKPYLNGYDSIEEPDKYHKLVKCNDLIIGSTMAYRRLVRVIGTGILQHKNDRNSVYGYAFPMDIWDFLLENLVELYKGKWNSSYGGEKWKIGVVFAKELFNAYLKADFTEMVLAFDRLINHNHNCGLMFDKFDCGTGLLANLLQIKAEPGNKAFLRSLLGCVNCFNNNEKLIHGCCRRVWNWIPPGQQSRFDKVEAEWIDPMSILEGEETPSEVLEKMVIDEEKSFEWLDCLCPTTIEEGENEFC